MRARVAEVVSDPGGGRVVARLDGVELDLPKLRSYSSVQVGDQVLLVVGPGGAGYCLGALGTAPPPPKVEDPDEPTRTNPPSDDPVRGSKTFKPTSTGTYRGGWRGDTRDLYQGDWTGRGINTGAAYFGRGPSSLRGSATRVVVRYKRGGGGSYGAVAPTFRLLGEKSRSGAPSFVAQDTGKALRIGEKVSHVLPDSWGDQLISGSAGGIGIHVGGSSPYLSLVGGSISLTIEWRR